MKSHLCILDWLGREEVLLPVVGRSGIEDIRVFQLHLVDNLVCAPRYLDVGRNGLAIFRMRRPVAKKHMLTDWSNVS